MLNKLLNYYQLISFFVKILKLFNDKKYQFHLR